ncbi:MAG TPA: PfkB family carbohydrate kinase [Cyclobacteriaceae bacterium]|jgi:D-beta-D-heptose 7-phosphate kinase/D-beta-D-heptose 1-phosphate adenosyltransferase|nr:PfkB family carbohydrate kinase [Cyclobacteriaceae bacterium]
MTNEEILQRAKTLKIAIIGDLIEDRYIIGDVHRVSPEAPVVVVSKTSETTYAGGAGNVFMNLVNLGVDAYLFTRGNPRADILCDSIFIHPGRTPIKTRIMSNNHHLLRVDDEESNPDIVEYDDLTWKEDFEKLFPSLDAIIFSDYHKGTISPSISNTIISLCNEFNIPVFVDAKRDFDKYKHALMIKCNKHEAKDIDVEKLRSDLKATYFVVTTGETGMTAFYYGNIWLTLAVDVGVVDVCGAGDIVIAIAAMAFAAGMNMIPALDLSNKAAGESCKHAGVYALTKEDFLKL